VKKIIPLVAALGLIISSGCHSDQAWGRREAILGSGPSALFSSRLFQEQQYDRALQVVGRHICGDTHYMPFTMITGLIEAVQEPGWPLLLEQVWGELTGRCGITGPCSGSSIIAHYSLEASPPECQWVYIMNHTIIEALLVMAPGMEGGREARIREIFQPFLSDATGIEIPYEPAEYLYAGSYEKQGSCCCDQDDETYAELAALDFPAMPPPLTGDFSPDQRYGGPGHRTWREEVAFQACSNCGFNLAFDPVEQVWCRAGGGERALFSAQQCAQADWSRIEELFPAEGEWGRQACNIEVGSEEKYVLAVLAADRGDGTGDWRIMACLNDGTGSCRESLHVEDCTDPPNQPDGYPGPSGLFWDH